MYRVDLGLMGVLKGIQKDNMYQNMIPEGGKYYLKA